MTSAKRPSQNSSSLPDDTLSQTETAKLGNEAVIASTESESELLEKWSKFASAFNVSQANPIRVSSLDSLRPKK